MPRGRQGPTDGVLDAMDSSLSLEPLIRSATPGAAGQMLAGLAEIAIVIDREGVVRQVPHVAAPLEPLAAGSWRGRRLLETIVPGSRAAVIDLIGGNERAAGTPHDLVHRGPGDVVIPVRYGAAELESGRAILLLGRSVAPAQLSESDFGSLFALGAQGPQGGRDGALADIVRQSEDLVLLIDRSGRMLWANDAFRTAAEISRLAGVDGRFLEDLIAWREPADIARLIATAEEAGTAGPAAGILRGDAGGSLKVEIAITRLPRSSPPVLGAVLRPARLSRPAAPRDEADGAPLNGLLDRAGRVPLKGLVRETADLVERQCLEAALRLTSNNRSAAARTLGISRQALYQKLERFGLAGE